MRCLNGTNQFRHLFIVGPGRRIIAPLIKFGQYFTGGDIDIINAKLAGLHQVFNLGAYGLPVLISIGQYDWRLDEKNQRDQRFDV